MQNQVGRLSHAFIAATLGLLATTASARTFDERDLEGAWVLTAQGAMLGTSMPLAMLGIIEFDVGGGCRLNGTINAGGLSWSSRATACKFHLNADGNGQLTAKLPRGPVMLSTIPLSFVVIDDQEIRVMATDNVNLSGVLRRQDR